MDNAQNDAQLAKAPYDSPLGLVGATTAAKQSPLSSLFDQQDKTRHLLQVLGEKLSPVSNPTPVDGKERVDRGYHVETALYNQQDINNAISYLIDTLVV